MTDARQALVRERVAESIAVKQAVLESGLPEATAEVAGIVERSLRAGGKVLLCGNGGSAADAAHLAAEFVGRFQMERPSLPAIALGENSSTITAVGNDYAFDEVFARQVRGLGAAGDVLLAFSTSGGSPNVIAAVDAARERGITTVGITGSPGGTVAELADVALRMPSDVTARIQEAYMALGHALCELVETALAP